MDITFILTIGTPLLIIAAIIKSDRFQEPTALVIKTFFLGVFLCYPAGELNYLFIPSDEYSFVAGFTEESLKFLALYFYIKPKKSFNEPMDAIVYGTIISLGFASLENFDYVYSGDPEISALAIAVIRAISAIPLHATCGVVMGYFFGLYAFSGSKILLIKSLAIPMLIHASYNFLVGVSDVLWFFALLGAISYARGLHQQLSALQKEKKFEAERKVV
tara:strand:+ start:40 stop:693 length:654 start_codon:yes stop_codon:yes gene_type:complete